VTCGLSYFFIINLNQSTWNAPSLLHLKGLRYLVLNHKILLGVAQMQCDHVINSVSACFWYVKPLRCGLGLFSQINMSNYLRKK